MSLSDDDLEDYVEKFRNIIYKQNDYKTNETDLWSLIENLTKELELSTEREECLRKNLIKCLECENADITTKVVSLRERCDALERENVDLKDEMNSLKTQLAVDVESQKEEYLRKLAELDGNYKSEINNLKQQFENDKMYFESKEKDLYNELQLAQAASALQCDEIESNLKRQLVDANIKLRNSQNIIRTLQMDINSLRNQLASQKVLSYPKPPATPEIRFNPLPVTSTRPSVSFEDLESDNHDFFEPPQVRSVTPLSTTSVSTPLRNPSHLNRTPLVFKGIDKPWERTPTTKPKKKRKLYDPDNFDHSNIPTF